ncbi:hypothetical protein B0H17DRAFT_1153497 [Mycena rosella]|uniref:Uncharacterized protein n=1 Tax=Mycena rosella TaxID=1033263 RepID=A0AAD7FCW5_MYCRO|nr:hypothetical protein B0H17DRAFT_1153497 [Mycena rosella]
MISFEKYGDTSGTLSHHLENKLTTFRYVKKNPAGFRVGDIVEMGFTLVTFRQASRNKDDKQICKLVLRTLKLLDDLFAKVKMQWWNESKEDCVRVSIKNIFGDTECSANCSESKNPGMLANNLRTMTSLNILGQITALRTMVQSKDGCRAHFERD